MEQEIALDAALKRSSTKIPEAGIVLQGHNIDGDNHTRLLLSNAIAKYNESVSTAQMGVSGVMDSKTQRKNSSTSANQAQQPPAGSATAAQPNGSQSERKEEKKNSTIDLCSLDDEESSANEKKNQTQPTSARNVSDSVLRQHEEAWAAHNRTAASSVEDQLKWRLAALRHNHECNQNAAQHVAQASRQPLGTIPVDGADLLLDNYLRSYQRWVQENAAAITNRTAGTSIQEQLAQLEKTRGLTEAAAPAYMFKNASPGEERPAKRTLSLPHRSATDVGVVSEQRRSLPLAETNTKDKEVNKIVDPSKRKRDDSNFSNEHWEHFPNAMSSTFESKKRVDTPITYLVRQLLGQIPVTGNEPPVVLDAKLIQDLSSKIRLIVDRIIELAVENALKNSRPQDVPDVTDMVNDIQAKAQVIKELSENLQMKTEDIDFLRGNLEKQTNDYQRTFHALEDLKKFTKSQSDKVQEQDQIILKLRQQLEERTHVVIGEQEARQVVQLVATPNFINRDSELIQSLVQQLQGGVSKVQLQHRQIAALQGQISTDETALKAKDETIRQLEEKLATTEQSVKTLRENVEKLKARPSLEELTVEQENEIKLLKYEVKRLKGLLDTLSLRVSEHEHTSAHQKEKELSHLRTEVKELQESLRTEKQNAEANMRAYMRASIHALKKHRAASSGTGNHE